MPPLQLTVVAPVPAPTLPSAKSVAAARGRRIAELAIGRKAAPVLVAAVEEIEQDRRRHDRHPRGAHRKAAALLAAARPARRRRHRGRRPSRPTSVMASMPSTVCAGSSSAVSRVPGPPPRMSIEPIAGSSKIIAVAPEPSRMSSAWPTLRPATSVMRLRKAASHNRLKRRRSARRRQSLRRPL